MLALLVRILCRLTGRACGPFAAFPQNPHPFLSALFPGKDKGQENSAPKVGGACLVCSFYLLKFFVKIVLDCPRNATRDAPCPPDVHTARGPCIRRRVAAPQHTQTHRPMADDQAYHLAGQAGHRGSPSAGWMRSPFQKSRLACGCRPPLSLVHDAGRRHRSPSPEGMTTVDPPPGHQTSRPAIHKKSLCPRRETEA